MFEKCLTPENIEGLKPVRINDLLYKKLPFHAKVNDQKLRGLNTFIARGCGPLVSAFEQLCLIETVIEKDTISPTIEFKDGKVCINNDQFIKNEFDISKLRTDLGNSLKLLTSAHCTILARRKHNLKPYLDRKFHHLTRDSNPVTNELLGSDLEQRISESMKGVDVARKLTPYRSEKLRDYRGRGRGLPRGSPRYQSGYTRYSNSRQERQTRYNPYRGNRRNYNSTYQRGMRNNYGRPPRSNRGGRGRR